MEDFFGGADVFKNILQYEDEELPIEELRLAAAYLLINQLLFYHAISKFRPEFPSLEADGITRPMDLKYYFAKVTDVDYKVIFSYDVASLIPDDFTEQVKTIVSVINALGPEKVGGDMLGTIFHDLIPFETRKKVAAFYTNVLIGEMLATLCVEIL